MVKTYVPAQGDIVMLQFHPQRGREQSGMRPALVLSPEKYNGKVGLMLACPITSKAKGYPFEVALPTGMKTHGVVLADHVKSLDYGARGVKFVESMPREALQQVLLKLQLLMREEE
ncbi:mRNA-degrading endonuclease [Candidatus Peribacteria bacterium RIFCSPHIGHO2_01_FULL_55_13]|nr:MAG: mRNA-degrading endonuclease [Candidatus Peribacteria bacterium RIFCSPHIGHO2_01_FULL_55_13]OGJ66260.1 MAG: mRNA-degrading endonuclease [Candidatus Peribacteria bacterium RIFCSPHIGHO2_12_FULL_55_11]